LLDSRRLSILGFAHSLPAGIKNRLLFSSCSCSQSILCALAGGNCTNGFAILPLIKGSTWQIADGIWALSGCPAGYYLAVVCQPCPSFFYCTGGSLPSTSCASGQYSLPRATSEAECFAVVFVIVVINVPITRQDFDGVAQVGFQGALARAVGLSPDYVYLEIIQAGSNPSTTTVTLKIATVDAKRASAVFQGLDSGTVQVAYTSMGLGSPTLISVQETACVPGYELDSKMEVCLPCPYVLLCGWIIWQGFVSRQQLCCLGRQRIERMQPRRVRCCRCNASNLSEQLHHLSAIKVPSSIGHDCWSLVRTSGYSI